MPVHRSFSAALLTLLSSLLPAQSRPGSFVPAPGGPIPVGPMAGRPVLADLNGDHHLDVVLACGTCCGSEPDPDSGHVMLLLGDGKGGFTPAPGYPLRIGSSARKLAVGDLDGDGFPDVVVAQHESYDLVVLINDGTGQLTPDPASPVSLGKGPRPHTHEVALADLDGDGDLDVLATLVNDGVVAILRNDGKGGFTRQEPVRTGRHPYDALAVQDLDGDRKPDLLVPNLVVHTVTLLRGSGDGRFALGTAAQLAPRPGYLAVGDVNGDGRADVLASHDDDALVSVLLGDGKGGFAHGEPLLPATPVWGSVLADLDGDGALDFAAAAPAVGVVVLRNDGTGRSSPVAGSPFAAGRLPSYVAAGDLDEDGRVDLVAAGYGSGDVTVLLNRTAPAGRAVAAAVAAATEPTLRAAARALTAADTDAAGRRRAWCQVLAAGQLEPLLATLRTSGGPLAVAGAYLELLDVASGSPAMKEWAERAAAACDEALAGAGNHREARWLKARALAVWPKSFGKTGAAVAELETLLAQGEAARVPERELTRARTLLAELRRR